MPTAAKKKKPTAKKKILVKKKTLKRSGKTMARKITKKVTRKLVKKAAKKSPVIGKVIHYYDRIGVAVLELRDGIRLGDMVLFRRGDSEFMQVISSLHIDHVAVPSAKKGQDVGLKVDQKVEDGTLVLKP
jgi:putative protease